MRLSRSISVSARRKNQRLGSLRARKKQKRLDAICEKAYNRNQGGAKTESHHYVGGGGSELNESELQRSTRVRKAPMVLDASPRPAQKRRIVEKGMEMMRGGWEEERWAQG